MIGYHQDLTNQRATAFLKRTARRINYWGVDLGGRSPRDSINFDLSTPLTLRPGGANHPHRTRTSSWSQPRRLSRARSRPRARDSCPLTVPTGH